jgi:low affinity Fe/Cu permease
MVKKKQPKMTNLEKFSIKVTDWVGTPYSLIVHTILFIGIFALKLVGFSVDQILLILTTAVSLEAIYLAILIQMTVNRNTASLQAVEEDIDDIQEDVEDIQEDVEELEEEVEDITEDIEHGKSK